MRWDEWSPIYARIREEFAYPLEKDEAARDLLDALLAERPRAIAPDRLRSLIEGETATVYGPASLGGDWRYTRRIGPTLCADSAIDTFSREGGWPDVIVTDLDGDAWKQAEANRAGAIVVVHAHGDNMDRLREWVPRLHGPVIGTCQCEPRGRVHNFGGFTDGDRAVLIADHFRAREILLVGFDYEHPVPARGKDAEIKRRKLAWARGIIAGARAPVRHATAWTA